MASGNFLDEDLALWNKFRSGDKTAFSVLMKLHYNDLFNYATRFSRDVELVKDCIQDLFLALWKNRMTINETSFVKYYLLRSLRNKLSRAIRKRRLSIHYEFQFQTLFNDSHSTEQALILQEGDTALTLKMVKLLSCLSRRQQEVIYLRYYMDAEIEEIAEIASLERQSVYNLLHDALKRLKKISAEST